jgi:hypothetical protein
MATEFINTFSGCKPRQLVERREINVSGLSLFSKHRIIFGVQPSDAAASPRMFYWPAVFLQVWKLSPFVVLYTDNMITGILLPEMSPLCGKPNIIFTCWTEHRRCDSSSVSHDFPLFCPCPANVILVFSAFCTFKGRLSSSGTVCRNHGKLGVTHPVTQGHVPVKVQSGVLLCIRTGVSTFAIAF